MGNKHASYDLAQMQSLPLEAKIQMTKRRIEQWYDHFDGQVYVSRSGGKDSDVLGHIVKQMYQDVPHVFVNTGLEYDSVRLHAQEECDTILRPEKSFVQVVTQYGYPIISKEVSKVIQDARSAIKRNTESTSYAIKQLNGQYINPHNGEISPYNKTKWKFLVYAPFRISNECCNQMKKKPAKHYAKQTDRKPFIGTMAAESRLRKTKWVKFGCNAFEQNRPTSQPMSFWTEQDILQYIKINNIEVADVYGEIVYVDNDGMEYENEIFDTSMKLQTTGAKRTGCVFCMFGIGQDKERFLRLKYEEPKKFNYVMRGGKFDEQGLWVPHNGLGYKFVIDWLNENGNLGIKY